MSSLVTAYDAALFDLDGVVYLGPKAIDGVPEALSRLREVGTKLGFVTNNAARTPEAVAKHLVELGIAAEPRDVVNSTQATLRMMTGELPAGSRVLVVGTAALAEQLGEAGFVAVSAVADNPVAVIQGYHPSVEWSLLEAGAQAIQQGAVWYATNPDITRPTEKGIMPGCGAQVAVIQTCVSVEPRMAGKPFPPLLEETKLRLESDHPIFVGDRLETDVMGANNVGMDSLFVFTGAHGKFDLVTADPIRRPTYIGYDVSALLEAPRSAQLTETGATCGSQQVELVNGVTQLRTDALGLAGQLDALWATLQLVWHRDAQPGDVLDQLTLLR